ncbi:MAG: T9SS type A sorting domain-containing protein, partial [Calditrichales bacterium]
RDSNLAIVDSFKMKNGYETDFHEFLLLPNGHAMLMSYHTILYDMSKIVEGGRTDASLIINIIQEQDKDKNVVFEWRNIDYIPITDTDLNLTDPRINYGTLNAFSIDTDGNILASFRNHSEIMKISRATGEVMWRWGSTRGEFTFIGEHEENEPFFFARQHHIKRLQNGNVTIFDNGQFHVPPYSRAVEYALDEVNKTATLVSEFRYPAGNIFAAAAGNAQKLADGGWFIGYGILSPQSPVKRNIVETHADGSIAFEISLPNNVIAYRASKSAWRESVHKPSVTRYELFGGNMYDFNDPSNITGVSIDFIDLVSYSYNYATVTRLPYAPLVPEFFGELPAVYPVSVIYEGAAIDSHTPDIHIDLTVYPEIIDPATTSIYWRQFPNNGLFLQMPTTYDNNNNELITRLSGFGELVFGSTGYEYAANPPILYEPVNKIKLLALESIALRWTGQGLFDAFNIQVSNDSLFNVILVDTTLDASLIFVNNIVNHTTYYWRVRSILGVDESAWSPVWRFSTTDPFIEMISPNGAEEWYLGSKEVIRWETNILDTVLIDLLKDQQIYTSIGEIPGKIDAFAWKIPENLPASSEYAIQIRSKLDTNLSAIGKDSFSLIDTINTGISNYLDMIPDAFTLDQNYPNPFNPETNIQFEVPQSAYITLKVFNIKGALVATLTDGQLPAGRYTLRFTATNLASGIYFYTLQSSGFKQVRKMMFLK